VAAANFQLISACLQFVFHVFLK